MTVPRTLWAEKYQNPINYFFMVAYYGVLIEAFKTRVGYSGLL